MQVYLTTKTKQISKRFPLENIANATRDCHFSFTLNPVRIFLVTNDKWNSVFALNHLFQAESHCCARSVVYLDRECEKVDKQILTAILRKHRTVRNMFTFFPTIDYWKSYISIQKRIWILLSFFCTKLKLLSSCALVATLLINVVLIIQHAQTSGMSTLNFRWTKFIEII